MASTSTPVRTGPRLSRRWRNIILALVALYLLLLLGPVAGFQPERILREIAQNPALLIQQILVGLANGSIIAIIALGYTMVYGIIELINFAHADVFMLGTFMGLTILGLMGISGQSSPGAILVGILVAFLAGLGAIFFEIPALSLTVSAAFVLLMSGLILFETSNIIHGGETNYIMATVSLFVSIFNLFTSLLHLLGFANNE